MILCLHNSLVQPVMEYGKSFWAHSYILYYDMDKQAIEKVQCRATKIIPKLRHFSYQECLATEVISTITCLQEIIFLHQLTCL